MRRWTTGLLVLLVALSFSAPAFAQGGSVGSTGTIFGRVADAQGAVLPGVTVVVTSPAMMGSQTTVTNEQGNYRFPAIPPGVYGVSFELPGFNTLRREGIQISLGFTANINVELQLATVQETVTVSGSSPVIDTTATRTQSNFKLEDLANLPNARDMWSLLAVTPGVAMSRIDVGGNRAGTQTGYVAYGFGNNDQQVRVSVEGINTTEGTGGAGFYFDYGSFEEVFLGTSGNGAEAATPGVQSQFLGRSGSNKFQGGVYVDWYNNSLQASNLPADYLAPVAAGGFGFRKGSNEMQNYRDMNFNGGGPIKTDKIWWYGSYRRQENSITQPNLTYGGLFDTELWNWTGKTTFQLNQAHKLIAYYQWGQKIQPNRLWNGAYTFARPEDTTKQDSGSWVWKGEWNGTLSNNLFIEARYGDFGYYFPLVGSSNLAFRQDQGTRTSEGGDRIWQQDRDRRQATGSASYFKDNVLGGTHNLRVGGEFNIEKQWNGFERIRAGNVEHIFNNGAPFRVIVGFPTADGPVGSKGARANLLSIAGLEHSNFFVNDSFSRGRVTLNVGLRFDHYRSFIPDQKQIAATTAGLSIPAATFQARDFFKWNSVVPRVGMVYDLSGTGTMVLKASYGYFKHNPGPGAAANGNPNQASKDLTYTWNDLNGDRLFQNGEQVTLVNDRTQPAGTVVDPGITQPYSHEFSTFAERQLSETIGMRVGYVYKSNDNLTQNYQPFRGPSAFTVPFNVTDIGPDKIAGTSDDQVRTFLGIPNSQLGAATQVFQNVGAIGRFSTVEVSFTKRYSNRWSGGTGLGYTKSKENLSNILGNALTADNRAPGFPQGPNDPVAQNTTGWGWNAYGSYDAPWGIRVSPVLRHRSGQNYGRTLTISAPASCACAASGTVLVEDFDSRRMDNIWVLDARIEKRVSLPRNVRVGLFADMFNLSNSHASETISFNTGAAFDRPTAVLAPLTMRIGFKLDF